MASTASISRLEWGLAMVAELEKEAVPASLFLRPVKDYFRPYGLDYSQSSIWSPLVPIPPHQSPIHIDIDHNNNNTHHQYHSVSFTQATKSIASSLFRSLNGCYGTNFRRFDLSSSDSPVSSSSSNSAKTTSRVLKVSSTCFKRTGTSIKKMGFRSKNKRDPTAHHVKLRDYLMAPNF